MFKLYRTCGASRQSHYIHHRATGLSPNLAAGRCWGKHLVEFVKQQRKQELQGVFIGTTGWEWDEEMPPLHGIWQQPVWHPRDWFPLPAPAPSHRCDHANHNPINSIQMWFRRLKNSSWSSDNSAQKDLEKRQKALKFFVMCQDFHSDSPTIPVPPWAPFPHPEVLLCKETQA